MKRYCPTRGRLGGGPVTARHEAAPSPRDVVAAGPAERGAIADALSDAFFDDPVWAWILPDEGSRRRRLAGLFAVLLRGHYEELGAVFTTAERAGASLWAPPGRAVVPVSTVLRYSPWLGRALGRRSLVALRALTRVEREHPAEPHWYLGVLGTRTAHQGKGIGSALLEPVLRRCDDEGVPAYLESSKERNVPLYTRFGFEVVEEYRSAGGSPPIWRMWREPQVPEG